MKSVPFWVFKIYSFPQECVVRGGGGGLRNAVYGTFVSSGTAENNHQHLRRPGKEVSQVARDCHSLSKDFDLHSKISTDFLGVFEIWRYS